MHLIANGLIKFEKRNEDGMILITNRSIFFFRPVSGAAQKGAIIGGVLGAIIGGLIDKKKAEKMELDHLNDPEIQDLDEKSKKQLSRVVLVKKLSLSNVIKVTPTFWGFKFVMAGTDEIEYKGKAFKKKMSTFLRDVGVRVEE